MGYNVEHAVQAFQMLHSVNEKRWGQVSTLLHTMLASTTIGNQQSLPWCHPGRWFVFLYLCEEDLCQRKLYAGFLKSKSKNCPQKLRYQDFLLPGIFAPRSESSQWEPSLPGTKIPGNFHSRERIFLGNFVPDIASLLSDHGKGCWHCSESKLKKYGKMNANNIYLYCCWIRLRLSHTVNVNVRYRDRFASSLWENHNE